MSPASVVAVSLIRPCTVGVRRLAGGATAQVDPDTAIQLIRAGFARLVDESDLARLIDMNRPKQLHPRLLAR